MPRSLTPVLLLVALLAALVPRTLQLELPLERDEGEYAYAGARLLEGAAPYDGVYTMKLPGTHAAYALIQAALGPEVTSLRAGIAGVHALCVLLVFVLARRWLEQPDAALAALVFAVLTVGGTLLGIAGHATHFVVLFGLAGLALLHGQDAGRSRTLAAGVCLGLAVLAKQSGASLLLYGLLATTFGEHRGRLPLLAAGAAAPWLALAAWLVRAGTWDTFARFGLEYAGAYAGGPLLERAAERIPAALRETVLPALPFWLLAFAGLSAGGDGERTDSKPRGLALFAACSALGVLPGLYLRPHYFLAFAPALAILAVRGMRRVEPRAAGTALLVVGLAWIGWSERTLVTSEPTELSRALYGDNPFVESEACAAWLRERAAEGDTLAVLGSEPQLPYLAGLRSASGFLYMYPLTEVQPFAERMQRDFITEVEAAAPRFVVDVDVPWSWLERPDSVALVGAWRPAFLDAHYRLVQRFPVGPLAQTGTGELRVFERRP